jgi:hypothetical protein
MAKINESDLVNDTGKKQLSVRNQEPTHLSGASYTDIGGVGIDSKPNTVKIDATNGVGTDSSIKGAGQNREPSNLPDAGGVEGKMDLAWGEDGESVDDIDKELDDLEDLHEVEIEVGKKDDADDEKEKEGKPKFGEEGEGTDSGKLSFSSIQKEEDDENDDKKDLHEDDDEPFGKFKKKSDDGDDDDKGGDDDKDKGDDDDKGDKKGETKVIVKEDENPFAKKKDDDDDDEKKDKKVEETFRVVISTPAASLFESAGLAPKTQKKVATIFEQAIRSNTKQIAKQLHEHYSKKYRAQLAERNTTFEKQIDGYLSFVVEEWVKSNRVAVRTSLRAQMAEELLGGLQQLFKEHYIDVPESKVDVVKTLAKQVETLKESQSKLIANQIRLRRLAEAANKARIVAQFGVGMSVNEVAKLTKLAEDIKYDSAKDFREKLTMLRESYFGTPDKKDTTGADFKHLPQERLNEQTDKNADKKPVVNPDDIGGIVAAAISQQHKSNTW